MKICFLTDAWIPVWGGGQVHIQEVSKILEKKHDCQVDIIAPTLINKNFNFNNFFHRIWFTFWVLKFLLTSDYDLYHGHSYSTSLFLPLVKFFKRGKIVFTLHGMGSSILGAGFINKLGISEILSKFVVYKIRYDALITVAKKSLTEKTNTGLVVVIGNGINLEKYDKIPAKGDKMLFNLLWVGRMVPVKGLFLLLSVFGKLSLDYPKLHLRLIGDGPERFNLESQVKKLKLQKKISFAGSILGKENDLIQEYKKADVFVLPSLSAEGFPISIIEAMASKLPVIASDIGDTDLLVQNEKTGFLVKPNNSKDLEDKIIKLIESKNRVQMGINGYNLVKEKYTWDLITQEIYEVYLKILK